MAPCTAMSLTQWLTRSCADGVVDAELEGDLEFGAYAVGRGDEDGVGELLEVEGEEAAEAADFGEDMLVEGLAREHLDALLARSPEVMSTPASA